MERTTTEFNLRYSELVEYWRSGGNDPIPECVRQLLPPITPEVENIVKEKLRRLNQTYSDFYKKHQRNYAWFQINKKNWLETKLILPVPTLISPGIIHVQRNPAKKRSYDQMAPRTKRNIVAKISKRIENEDTRPMMKAVNKTLVKRKQFCQARVLTEIFATPNRGKKVEAAYKKAFKQKNATPEEALSLLLELSLSKERYIALRKFLNSKNHDVLPPYWKVQLAKKECRPPPESVSISDLQAEVKLEPLLHHTVSRILKTSEKSLENELKNIEDGEMAEATLTLSWGMDGASGHGTYNQALAGHRLGKDASLFGVTIVPLELKAKNVIWKNPAPRSGRFCRPICLKFEKESEDLALEEKRKVEEQISQLKPFEFYDGDKSLTINFDLHLTLLDGKILDYFTGSYGTVNCPFCHAKPSQLNNLTPFIFDLTNTQYGASPLHASIRFMELILHLSYKNTVKKGRSNTKIKKEINAQKIIVRKALEEKMGLIVDQPRDGGRGTSNTGNTARRAFKNHQLFAECTGIDPELIKRFKVILIALNCECTLDPVKFGEYCRATKLIYLRNYSWYNLTPTVHKIIDHGKEIIENSVLPVGVFGEDAAEARNKDYRNFREHFTRKSSRKNTMEDLFNRCLDTSDPFLSSNRIIPLPKAKEILPEEVLNLILSEENPQEVARKLQFEDIEPVTLDDFDIGAEIEIELFQEAEEEEEEEDRKS